MNEISNRLSEVRRARGESAADLAHRVGVSRQAIHAMEAGGYSPNTAVALKLARELEVPVEELFWLDESQRWPGPAGAVPASVLSATPVEDGQALRLCRVGGRMVGVPAKAVPYFLPEADGMVVKGGRAAPLFTSEEDDGRRLVVAGCDPAIGLLGRTVERESGVDFVPAPASSRLALRWLMEGKVQVAGSHLKDPESGEFNVPILRREYPGEDLVVVTFARWDEGIVTARGNPKEIREIGDLARGDVRLMNRETGSGSRALLDRELAAAGVSKTRVAGYERVAYGHLAAAYAVVSGEADACIAARSAAQAFGLAFQSLEAERYDFVLTRPALELQAVQALLDVLQKTSLRRKLERLAGYDTTQTGATVA